MSRANFTVFIMDADSAACGSGDLKQFLLAVELYHLEAKEV